jgi:hypothetical protein
MTTLLEKALAKIEGLPAAEQDAIASQILASLGEDEEWELVSSNHKEEIRRLAQEALAEVRRGTTTPLDEVLDRI